MSFLIEPFRYEFFRNGIVVMTIGGALCGLVGVYVVLRGMSYIGHGLSHSIFGGAVASFVAGVNFYIGAGIWGFVSLAMISGVARRRKVGADAAIGVVTTASLAVGVALISLRRSFTRNFEAALFGYAVGVKAADVIAVTVVALAAALFVFVRYRALLFSTFDPEVADISGVSTARIDAMLAVVLAASILATMQILGVLLIAAALVIPAATARMIVDRFGRMLVLSVSIGALSGFAGMFLSYFLNIATGATVVLFASVLFIAAFTFSGSTRRRPAAPSRRASHSFPPPSSSSDRTEPPGV